MCDTKCCCMGGHGHHRRYLTKEEQIERLQRYAQGLEKELQAVKERIDEIR